MMTSEASINDNQYFFELGKNTFTYRAFHLFFSFLAHVWVEHPEQKTFFRFCSLEKSKELFEKPKPPIRFPPVRRFKLIDRALLIG
jgi:hypothetical protein